MADELFPISDTSDGFAPSDIDEGLPTRAEFDLAIDFWFETGPTFSDVFWPIALAVAWIAWRDADLATSHFDRFRTAGRRYWLDKGAEGRIVEPREAERLLLNALRAGELTAYGVNVNTGDREPVAKFRWIDLRLFGPNAGDLLENAVIVADGRKVFTNILLESREVQAVWRGPTPPTDAVTSRASNRKSRSAFNALCAAMRAHDHQAFAKIPPKALVEVFGSNRESCRLARLAVLAERKSDNN